MASECGLDQAALQRLLNYDPMTGIFTWKGRHGVKEGKVAGYVEIAGYVVIMVGRRCYRAHRLAWLYVYGYFPDEVDHIHGDKQYNRISELREASRSQQTANAKIRSDNTSGFKGVTWHRAARRWMAQITCGGRAIYLGLFDSPAAAHAAYIAKARELFGEFARAG